MTFYVAPHLLCGVAFIWTMVWEPSSTTDRSLIGGLSFFAWVHDRT